jgi:hypothetical protein
MPVEGIGEGGIFRPGQVSHPEGVEEGGFALSVFGPVALGVQDIGNVDGRIASILKPGVFGQEKERMDGYGVAKGIE